MLKKIYSLKNKTFLRIWGIYHIGIIALFGILLLIGKRSVNIDADLFNMLPKPAASEAIMAADSKLTEITGKNVFILVSNPDFKECKIAAENAYTQLKDSPKFKRITLYQDLNSVSSLTKLVEEYKFHLLDSNLVEQINSDAESYQMQKLEEIMTGFFTTSPTEDDPFMISNSVMQNYFEKIQNSGTKMQIKDGVMTSFVDGKHYIMIQGVLSKEGAALASKENAVVQIHNVCNSLKTENTNFVYSGTTFHSYKSSTNASNEITIISLVSVLVVLIILFLVFRTPKPLIWSFLSIGVSMLIALCSTFIIFNKIHILTLIFGTSLIGSCIDYSLHFFINWKANSELNNGQQIRNFMLKGLSLSLISTVICYLVLLFAPFNLIKQMAIFSTTGITSTFLTAISIYPYIKIPEKNRKLKISAIMKTPSNYNPKLVGRIVVTLMFVLTIGTILICWFKDEKELKQQIQEFKASNPNYEFKETLQDKIIRKLHISNNLGKLYEMAEEDKKNELEASKVLQYNPSGWFIISGNSPEQVLQREEVVSKMLKEFNEGKEKGGFMCTSNFVPSKKTQATSYDAVGKLLDYADVQAEYLGFDSADLFRKAYNSEKNKFFDVKDLFETEFDENSKNDQMMITLKNLLSNYWLGQLPDGKYYSVILPVSVTNRAMYKQIAKDASEQICALEGIENSKENESIFFILKVADMNKELDNLTFTILISLTVVFIVIFFLLKRFYSWKQTFKIISVPVLIILSIFAIFYAFSIPIEFFGITGMILVFGLGLDYVIYMIENEKRNDESELARLEPFAITLSFVTTAVSFGALALSSFIPVHLMGLSIFIGLVAAFTSTFFYQRAEL